MRLTEKEYAALQDGKPPKKRSKYNNVKTVVDGIRFDSMAEAARYRELKLKERAGKISGLRLQVPYELIPPSRRYPRRTVYKADFVYTDAAGNEVVEDVKGMRTAVYKLKKKLMYAKYGIEITEIRSRGDA